MVTYNISKARDVANRNDAGEKKKGTTPSRVEQNEAGALSGIRETNKRAPAGAEGRGALAGVDRSGRGPEAKL